jgi:hypothetical protein
MRANAAANRRALTISFSFYSLLSKKVELWKAIVAKHEGYPMQDLFESYVNDLNKLRDAFHDELTATAKELANALANYASRSQAALASLMEKASARGMEFDALAAARLNQFRGLPTDDGPAEVDEGPLADTPTNDDQLRIAAAAERAVAEGLLVESEGDRKAQSGRRMTLVKSGPAV